jgi:hypothetical protein
MRQKGTFALLTLLVAACGAGVAAGPLSGDGIDAGAGAADATSEPDADASRSDATPDTNDAGADGDADDPVLLRFAVVGDFGTNSSRELAVANMIASWKPEVVVTVGDNNYSLAADSYDRNVGQYYHQFISPYLGVYGGGAVENQFFPAIGNHDWDIAGGTAYTDFFELPGNERYYEIDRGPVHFVFLDSDTREPDGVTPGSTQGAWAQAALGASLQPFQVVVFHHPAYTSGARAAYMDWPFEAWGADAVLTGHVHNYERLRSTDGLTYFVIGQGGNDTHPYGAIHPASQFRYNALDGAELVEVTAKRMRFSYFAVNGALVDRIALDPSGNPVP